MNDYTLCCNIPKCKVPLNETAWVTRCMHVFCPGHGQAYFSNPSPQICCPICNETNLKEVDILHCEINPSDMILAGITPERAIFLASKSIKLWWFQMQQQHNLNNLNITHLEKKNIYLKHSYSKMLNQIKQKYEAEIYALKTRGQSLFKKIEDINVELETTKKQLLKYKDTHYSQNHRAFDVTTSPLSPNWTVDNITTPKPANCRSTMDLRKRETNFFD